MRPLSMLGFAFLAVAATSCAGRPETVQEDFFVSITATVEAVDLAQRQVTLRGPQGGVLTLRAGDEVKRLHEIKAGDRVTADYVICIASELREPTEAERAAPLAVLDEKGRGPAEAPPSGGVRRSVRVVATIEALDRSARTVTLRGPRGVEVTARVQDRSLLERVRLGQSVVVTYLEALILRVEPRKD